MRMKDSRLLTSYYSRAGFLYPLQPLDDLLKLEGKRGPTARKLEYKFPKIMTEIED